MNKPETVIVDDDADQVSCDGGIGPLGHPKSWYTFDGKDEIYCYYCGRHFIKRSAAQKAGFAIKT
ncbi:MAG: zinc-finger domain-containing protein [Pseudomonadota bacterium]